MRGPDDQQLRDALRSIPFFSELSEQLREEIVAESTLLRLPSRDWLFRQGDPGDALYVIWSGRLEVVRERPPPSKVIRVVSRGAAVGELALLTDSARSASVRAIRDSELMRLSRETVLKLLHENQAFAVALTHALGRLLQASEPPPLVRSARSRVLAVVPLQTGVPVRRLSDQLLETIARWGRVTDLEQGGLEGLPTAEAEVLAAYGRTLDEREREHDYVVLVGGGEEADRPWNAFCARQADRVIAVSSSSAVPEAGARYSELEGCDLVLWGPPAETKGVVSSWIDALEPERHHFVESGAGFVGSVERAARRLLGRSVGIVLSGGFASGLAHIGVLEALVEGGVTIDRVGGTSAGAFIAAMFAMGSAPDDILTTCREQFVLRNPLTDYTVPRRSLIRGRKAEQMLRGVFGEARIEQLPLDLFCVSSDLLSADIVVHRRGSVGDAVRASTSVPGLVPPVAADGRLLVDGGVLNNFPVDVMVAAAEGPVIAVDVMARRMRPAAEGKASGDGAGDRRRRRAGPQMPNIYEILSHTTGLGSWRLAAHSRAAAQLVIVPDTSGFRMLDFRRLDAIVAVGRAAGRAALDDARALDR